MDSLFPSILLTVPLQSSAGATYPVALVVGMTVGVFALVGCAMAIGVMFGRRPISGSCGGIANMNPEDGESKCALCQNPSEACQELRRKMQSENH